MHQSYLLGIDTGGTFTDFVLWSEQGVRIHKVLSTPAAPAKAILQGINELGLTDLAQDVQFYIVHGSTVATNAILEGKGVDTVFITNQGFADMLTIGRQARPDLYNLQPAPIAPPVPAAHCLVVNCRVDAHGASIQPLADDELTDLVKAVKVLAPKSVAINLLFSYLNESDECRIAAALPSDVFVSRSSSVLPEYKEYERGITTWLNAYVGPLVQDYLSSLSQGVPRAVISIMQSSGGTIEVNQASEQAVHMVLSGPAGGLAAAKFIADQTQYTRMLTFDMGGTSTDVVLIEGDIQLTSEGHIGRYPVAIPMIDMHTIGAGGGSIASIDSGGLLQVGPESAGARPGPACYGGGGPHATVTDANLVLGRLMPTAFLGGRMALDVSAARTAIEPLAMQLDLSIEQTAQGIIDIANEHMVQALRVMSVQRGIDPRELTLTSFGGAGGLHVCALAQALEMPRALVPIQAGVLSALGMLVAPRSRQLSQTVNVLLQDCDDQKLTELFLPLQQKGIDALVQEGVSSTSCIVEQSVDLRYRGQSYYLNVPWDGIQQTTKLFHQRHITRYGHELDMPVELVNIRVAVSSESVTPEFDFQATINSHADNQPQDYFGLQVWQRDTLQVGQVILGPALITETISTTYVARCWQAMLDKMGNLVLTRID